MDKPQDFRRGRGIPADALENVREPDDPDAVVENCFQQGSGDGPGQG